MYRYLYYPRVPATILRKFHIIHISQICTIQEKSVKKVLRTVTSLWLQNVFRIWQQKKSVFRPILAKILKNLEDAIFRYLKFECVSQRIVQVGFVSKWSSDSGSVIRSRIQDRSYVNI